MPTVRITIKLFAQYREGRFKAEQRVYPSPLKAQDIIDELGVDKELPLGVLMVNGKHVPTDYLLKEGDEIALFPKIGGG